MANPTSKPDTSRINTSDVGRDNPRDRDNVNVNPMGSQSDMNLRDDMDQSTVRDASDRFGSKIRERGSQVFDDAGEWINDFYGRANNWLQDNRSIGMIGLVAVAGLVGYYIGRSGVNRTSVSSDYLKSSEM